MEQAVRAANLAAKVRDHVSTLASAEISDMSLMAWNDIADDLLTAAHLVQVNADLLTELKRLLAKHGEQHTADVIAKAETSVLGDKGT